MLSGEPSKYSGLSYLTVLIGVSGAGTCDHGRVRETLRTFPYKKLEA